MNQLFCGFYNCNPVPNSEASVKMKWAAMEAGLVNQDLSFLDGGNPQYNLPNVVLFPKVAGDVYAAVIFAMEHGIEISVKNSGHHYQGASTKANTLHLNMNHYARYASELGGLVECTEEEDLDATLENQPCLLALARGKEAHIRVGGGENWDKLYRAVKSFNEENGYKYHIVGAAAGTVSPMGWSMQGGLSGTTNGRTLGFGVDQILQVEMVLPLGHHVRFGPTEWETVEGFDYPKTTKVQGVCNTNPASPESDWVWEPCSDEIDFDGLWFAVCGGGGGTYGIVTSIQFQLHQHLPLEAVTIGYRALVECGSLAYPDDIDSPLAIASMEFVIDFFLDPSSLPGVTDEMSDQCGAPAFIAAYTLVHCFGTGSAETLVASWKQYLSVYNQTLVEFGVPLSAIESASVCYDNRVESYNDYAEAILKESGPFAGLAGSQPLPSYTSTTEGAGNVLVPREWILRTEENKLYAAIKMIDSQVQPYLAFGGSAATAHDQANSFSDSHRQAGLMWLESFEENDDFWLNKLPDMYDFSGPQYPGIYGCNHQGPNSYGPLKSNFTKPCPLDLTETEREDMCISRQEAIWGTEKLGRLEAIKEAVDPNHMLNCNGCVGNKLSPVTSPSTSPSTTPVQDGDDPSAPTSAPNSSAVEKLPSPFTCLFGMVMIFTLQLFGHVL